MARRGRSNRMAKVVMETNKLKRSKGNIPPFAMKQQGKKGLK